MSEVDIQIKETGKASRLLEILKNNFGKQVALAEIMDYVWPEDYQHIRREPSIRGYISKINRQIKPAYKIKSVRGVGYKLIKADDE